MKDKIENIGLGLIAAVIFFGIVYAVRVLPYGNDFRCLFAECRISK